MPTTSPNTKDKSTTIEQKNKSAIPRSRAGLKLTSAIKHEYNYMVIHLCNLNTQYNYCMHGEYSSSEYSFSRVITSQPMLITKGVFNRSMIKHQL